MHAITLDSKYGIPTVAIHTNAFEKVVQSVTRMHGMPQARYTFVPQPVMGKTAEQLRAYVDGKSPISGRPVMQEIIEGLTRPAEGDQLKDIKFDRSTPRLVDSDAEGTLDQLFLENNWTDKLPIVLPTEKRVREMLAHTSRKPDEVVGHMRSNQFRLHWEFTVEKVAVNAVMAGARPEYFPVILALAASGVSARGSTTSSMAAMVVVNGPIRNEISMNSGTGAMAPYNHANATIGRAIRLMLLNLGGGIAGIGSATIFATPMRYTACLTENVEKSPWETIAVSRGYGKDENVITCAMVESPRLCFDDVSQEPKRLLTGIADSMVAMGSWNMHARSDMVVAMGPQHAEICARAGMSRADVHRTLCEIAGRRVRDLGPVSWFFYTLLWRWPLLAGDAALTLFWRGMTRIFGFNGGPSIQSFDPVEADQVDDPEERPPPGSRTF